MKPAKCDNTRLEDFPDEELDAFGEDARGLLVEAELKIRLARHEMARIQEELDFRKAGTSRRPIKYWEDVLWNCLGFRSKQRLLASKCCF